jgi:ubiquinone/menaquinone biosynthesis C-methylase UbiE
MNKKLSTEKALLKTMGTPDGLKNAYLCYYEWDISNAYKRFYLSDEWKEITNLLSKYSPPSINVLDLGAGNGISSFALFKSGFKVTSLEPDSSELVGYGAIKKYKKNNDIHVPIVSGIGEFLPFKDHSFGLVYCRQVLHHASDLLKMMKEIKRILIPGGIFIATREHVVDDQESLKIFLENHALHKYTKSEWAYSVDEYQKTLTEAGFQLKRLLLSRDSIINHYPTSDEIVKEKFKKSLKSKLGVMGKLLSNSKKLEATYRRRKSIEDHSPGRMISFVAKLSNGE